MIEQADKEIIAHYPYPLAGAYAKAFDPGLAPADAHEELLNLFEVLLKYLTIILLTQYITDGMLDPNINKSLLNLQRASIGHWQGWLRDILRFYENHQRPLQLPEIATFYSAKHGGRLLQGATALAQVMTTSWAYKGPTSFGTGITTRAFFDLLGSYRNDVSHKVRPGPEKRAQVARILMPVFQALMESMAFVRNYPLVYCEAAEVGDNSSQETARYAYRLTDLISLVPTPGSDPLLLAQPTIQDHTLYLRKMQVRFPPILNLKPFLIYRRCKVCHKEQVFLLNPSDAKRLTYTSYYCADSFTCLDHLDDVRLILAQAAQRETSLPIGQAESPRLRATSAPSTGYHPGMVDVSNSSWPLSQPNGEYVAGRVLKSVALDAVTPQADDLGYVEAVRNCYRPWREELGFHFDDSAIVPPPAYVPGGFTYLPRTGGAFSGTRLWSLARVNGEVLDTRPLLVLGGPGAGKTTLLQFLARHYATPDGTALPVIISLRAWRDPPHQPRKLRQFIADFLADPPDPSTYPQGASLAPHLDDYLDDPDQQRRLVFLFDDYDRLPRVDSAEHARCVAEIRAFVEEYDATRIVITSRLLDYDGELNDCRRRFTVVHMNPWTPGEVGEYVRCNAPEWEAHTSNDRLLRLAEIPYRMVQLVDVARVAGLEPDQVLEQSLQELAKAFVARLFTFAERAGRGEAALRDRVQALLARLAAALQRDGLAGTTVAVSALEHYLGATADTAQQERLLYTAADATIVHISESGAPPEPRVGFAAPSLEDYFAQLVIGEATSAETLRTAFSSNQTDPILNAVEMMDKAGMLDSHG